MRFSGKWEDLHLLCWLKAPIGSWNESVHRFQEKDDECDSLIEKGNNFSMVLNTEKQKYACEALIS